MTDQIDIEALARRVVACKHWRWLSGMLLLGSDDQRVRQQDADWWNESPSEFAHLLPDLRDPATLGCLLALVRAAWGPGRYDVGFFRSGRIRIDMMPDAGRWPHFTGTEAEALAAALEAAPL